MIFRESESASKGGVERKEEREEREPQAGSTPSMEEPNVWLDFRSQYGEIMT